MFGWRIRTRNQRSSLGDVIPQEATQGTTAKSTHVASKSICSNVGSGSVPSHFSLSTLSFATFAASRLPLASEMCRAAGETHGGATARLIKTCGGRNEILREFPLRCSNQHYQRMLQLESSEQMLQIWSQTKIFHSFENTFSSLGTHRSFIPPSRLQLLHEFGLSIVCESLYSAQTWLELSRQISRPSLKWINQQIPKFEITHRESACGQSEWMWLSSFNLYPQQQ